MLDWMLAHPLSPGLLCAADRKSNMHYLAPLFITVDADTDNEEKMRNVVELFNSKHNRKNVRLTGLTGPDTVKVRAASLILRRYLHALVAMLIPGAKYIGSFDNKESGQLQACYFAICGAPSNVALLTLWALCIVSH